MEGRSMRCPVSYILAEVEIHHRFNIANATGHDFAGNIRKILTLSMAYGHAHA